MTEMPETSENPQCFKYVDFDLPFILFVKDSLADPALKAWAEAYSTGAKPLPYSPYAPTSEKPGHFILGGGFPVYIPPDDLANCYEVSLPELPELTVGLRLLRRVNPHKESVLMGEMPGDRTGRTSFSSVRVIFNMGTIHSEHHSDLPLFCKLAITAINHFVSHYRVIANRPYVGSVTIPMIQSFQVTTQFEGGEMITQHYGSGSGPLHGMGGAISDEEDRALRASVATPNPPSLEKTLDLNIRDYLDLHEWRLVVIESAVAFEAWISKFLRGAFVDVGLTDTEIEQKFLDNRGFPRSVTSIARHLVVEATGFDFEAVPEYSEWATKVRDLRNDIVHGKRFDITQSDATQAYEGMKNAISIIAGSYRGAGRA